MKVKVNVASEATAKRIFWEWATEVEDLASNILSHATEEENKELMTNCNGKVSEWGWAEYVDANMPALRNRIAAEMAKYF